MIGGIRIGSRKATITSRLPGKVRRASAYAAGTPTSSEITTTASATSSVTTSTPPRSNSRHVVAVPVRGPAGRQPPGEPARAEGVDDHRADDAGQDQQEEGDRAPDQPGAGPQRDAAVAVIGAHPLPPRRAPVQAGAPAEDQADDDQLDGAHDHGDRRGHRVVVLLERRVEGRDRDHPGRPGRVADQHRRGEHRERQHERQAERDGQAGRQQRQGDVPEPLPRSPRRASPRPVPASGRCRRGRTASAGTRTGTR